MHRYLLSLFIIFTCFVSSYAQEAKPYSARIAWGYASEKDLKDIVLGDFTAHPRDLTMVTMDGGYLLYPEIFDVPVDVYLKGGFAYYNEDLTKDKYEAVLYFKFVWNIDFADNRVRLGFGEGLSYVNDVLESEMLEAQQENDPYTSRFLNYLDISLDFDVGKLVRYKPLEDVYIGYLLKHRSGVFGLFNGVHGGSNYNSFYIEKNF